VKLRPLPKLWLAEWDDFRHLRFKLAETRSENGGEKQEMLEWSISMRLKLFSRKRARGRRREPENPQENNVAFVNGLMLQFRSHQTTLP
jgi:hypothetical protein